MRLKTCLASVFLLSAGLARANVIGTNAPACPLTAERISNLPAWKTYLANSERQRQADKDFLLAEMKAHGLTKTTQPKSAHNTAGLSLIKPPAWYAQPEAQWLANDVISFQTPAGGWCKNTDFTQHRRAPGEMFGAAAGSIFLGNNDFDRPPDARWSFVGTFDNGATHTQLRFLAKVISARKANTDLLKKSFLRGLDYIFAAQYPNGGWPQVWPLQGGYHDAITFNDGAMLSVLVLLREVAQGSGDFQFVPADARAKADASWKHGLACVLAAQVATNGKPTVWGQQHDPLTLQPVAARNYEMPSLTAAESSGIVEFLMQLPQPDSNVVNAVHAAVAWFEKTKIENKAFKNAGREGRKLVAAPGKGLIWARYYQIGTDEPIFGDRDQTIHNDVNEISKERRNGYAWFTNAGKRVLQNYAKWPSSTRKSNQNIQNSFRTQTPGK